jgi:hypothetical protein
LSEKVLKGQPNGLAFSRRERATQNELKKATISREAVSCNVGLGCLSR